MEYQIENGFVYKVEEIKTKKQTAIVTTFYDNELHSKLSYDKENKKVKVEVYNYLDEFQENYNDEVIFEYEGNTITAQAVNGVAEIDFIADEGLECTVKTKVPNFRNGEVIFIA